jgi:uncharacterized protein YggE
MKLRHILIASAALVVASLFAGVGLPLLAHAVGTADTQPAQRTVTVTGAGSISSAPDTATISLGDTSQGRTAAAAFAANSAAITKIVAALKAAGVDSKDIQTQTVYLSPRMSNAGDSVVGYDASNIVNVTVHNLSRAGAIIDAGVAAGANTVNGPSLTRSDSDAQYRQALKAAVADAKQKADALGDAAGFSVGAVQTVVENSASTPIPMMDKAAGAASQLTIEPGTQLVEASVTVTFAIS